jgi:hypothetical protein
MRDSARKAVGAHLNVQWIDATIPELPEGIRSRADAYHHLATSIPEVKKGEWPALVFVISDEQKPPPKRRPGSKKKSEPRPTRQAEASEDAWVELFQTEGQYSVFVPGRFFNVLRVEATKVKEDYNRYLCSEEAPVVFLTRKDGEVDASFEGAAKIKRNGVVRAMCGLMRKDGLVTTMKPFGRLHDLMRELEKVELALLKADEKSKELKKELAESRERDERLARRLKKPMKVSQSTTRTEQRLERFLRTSLLPVQIRKYKILAEEYALLKEIGVPPAKMPKEPVKPDGAETSSQTHPRAGQSVCPLRGTCGGPVKD